VHFAGWQRRTHIDRLWRFFARGAEGVRNKPVHNRHDLDYTSAWRPLRGIPFFILDAQFAKRTEPLTIAGPPQIEKRVREAMEVLFPKSSEVQQRFPIEFIELPADVAIPIRNCRVTAFPVVHFSGGPAYALRVDLAGHIITYFRRH
jgi:hypothetical protein